MDSIVYAFEILLRCFGHQNKKILHIFLSVLDCFVNKMVPFSSFNLRINLGFVGFDYIHFLWCQILLNHLRP